MYNFRILFFFFRMDDEDIVPAMASVTRGNGNAPVDFDTSSSDHGSELGIKGNIKQNVQ